MGGNKPGVICLYIFLGAIWLYCVWAGVINSPFLGYYTFDETFISDSGIFLWYGVTPRILDWPASPSVLLYGLIFGVSVFFQILSQLSSLSGFLDAFVVMDRAAYEYLFDREQYILAGRALQMLIVLVVMAWTVRFLLSRQHPLLDGPKRYLVLLVILSTHLVWGNSVVLRPEAISGVFFIHILCRLLFSEKLEKQDVFLLSVLYGLVVAERLIFLFMAPLFFAGIFLLSGQVKWGAVRRSLGIFILAFLAFCPFVLTDPLIISKAFFGGILAKVNDNPMASVFNWEFIATYFENPVNYLSVLLTFLGLYQIGRQKKVFYWIVAGNWLLFLFLVLRSSKIYDPHVLPGALINIFLIGLGLGIIADKLGRKRPYLYWTPVLLIAVGEMVSVVQYHRWVHLERNAYSAVKWIREEIPADAKVAVNIDIGLFLPPNDKALDRQIAATEDRGNQLRKLTYLMGLNDISDGKLSEKDIPLSASAFAFEDEALYSLQFQLLRKYGKEEARKRFDLHIYMEDNTLLYHGVSQPQAEDDFRKGEYDFWITDEILEGLSPVKEFADREGAVIRIYKASPGVEEEV